MNIWMHLPHRPITYCPTFQIYRQVSWNHFQNDFFRLNFWTFLKIQFSLIHIYWRVERNNSSPFNPNSWHFSISNNIPIIISFIVTNRSKWKRASRIHVISLKWEAVKWARDYRDYRGELTDIIVTWWDMKSRACKCHQWTGKILY